MKFFVHTCSKKIGWTIVVLSIEEGISRRYSFADPVTRFSILL